MATGIPEELKLEKDQGIALLTINRPDKMNAMTTEMWYGLRECIEDVRLDDEVKVLLITGSGAAFCSGSDVVKRLGARLGDNPPEVSRQEMLEPTGYVASLMSRLSKPIIGAINGAAAGAGLSLALLCDIRIASDKARFGATWVRVGLVPDVGASYLLPRLIGVDRSLELMLTGRVIDAQEAERLGMVTRVVPAEELLPASLELARKIAQGPTIAQDFIKRGVHNGLHRTLDQQLEFESWGQRVCRATEDHREGILAFREKRAPRFQGR